MFLAIESKFSVISQKMMDDNCKATIAQVRLLFPGIQVNVPQLTVVGSITVWSSLCGTAVTVWFESVGFVIGLIV